MMFQFVRSFAVACVFYGAASAFCADAIQTEYSFYTAPQGTSYFAAGLQAPSAAVPQANETVFLIDTSASQLGQSRLDTLQAVITAINALPDGTQVQIFAMDVKTLPLTAGFAAKGSPEIETALKTLHRRVPLGATDFEKGLRSVRKAFEGRSGGTNRSVLYLGDGRSMAKTLSTDTFKKEAEIFTQEKIAFTACSVGIQTNYGIIAAFANQTGGNLIELAADSKDEQAAKVAGRKLAESAAANVVWIEPESVKYPEGFSVYPQKLQPIRSDRATIVIGKTESETLPEFALELKGKSADKTLQLDYVLAPKEKQGGNHFLRAAVETASKDGGLTMPIIGWDSLVMMQELFVTGIANQIDKANAAVETGNPQKALLILNDVLTAEPGNRTAQELFLKAEKLQTAAVKAVPAIPYAAVQDEVPASETAAPAQTPVQPAQIQPAPVLPQTQADAVMVDAVNKEHGVVLQKIQNEVKHTIVDSSKRSKDDPQAAIQGLKLMQQTIRSNAALVPAERDALLDRLGNTLKQIQNELFISESRSVQEEADKAQERARQEAVREVQQVRVKAVQVFDRLDSLLDAKEYQAAIAVAEEATNMLQSKNLPEVTAGHAARRLAQMMYYTEKYEQLRYQRHVGFIDAFMEAEKSAIPVPDDPPISYIDRERWLLLTDYRRKKYSTITLADPDDFTKKVNDILERRDIRLNIDDTTTFADVIRQITSQLATDKIDIDLHKFALEEAGDIRGDSPIAPDGGFDHPGMRLRNVLKMLLEPHGMTYMVKNEMLLLTTKEEAEKTENLQIRVYPVGDLIMSGGGSVSSMGGMGGGMMGGMGGMMGGMGGMSGGMGGMMGGMSGGMGGMGGGMYSVPDEIKRSTSAEAKLLLDKAAESKNPAGFWANYFAGEQVHQDAVKEVVRRLVKRLRSKEHVEEQVIALVEAALISGSGEPWMYEALTLSLYLKGAPKEEILRAALSAADFCDDPMDLLNVGLLMRTTLALKREAFPLYQQALALMPPKKEFYSATLRLAEELYNEYGDDEPVKWIGLAILSQEWDGVSGSKMVQDASDMLAAVNNKMQKNGRSEAAKQLTEQIQEAKLRDCVVTVEWTGDASMDLMVREPADTYCWFLSPRSTSGGLLKPEIVINAEKKKNAAPVKKLVYICPRGFNGTYTLLLQKEWGMVANNLVKVSIDTNTAAGEKQTDGKAYPLKSEGIFVKFQLDSGRRTESAADAELAEADLQASFARQVVHRNRMLRLLHNDGVLGQTTEENASGNNTTTAAAAAAATRSSTNSTTTTDGTTTTGSPFATILEDRGKVGYQPEISTISEGVSFYSEAAVTPDRCYVILRPYFTPGGGGMSSGGYGGMSGGMSGGYGGMSGGMSGGYGGGMSGMSGMGGGMY